MDTIVCSIVGQKRMESGTHASGGMGRSTSTSGKLTPWKMRLIPMASPSGTPRRTPIA